MAGQQVPEGTKIVMHMGHILRHLKSPKLGDDLEDFAQSEGWALMELLTLGLSTPCLWDMEVISVLGRNWQKNVGFR